MKPVVVVALAGMLTGWSSNPPVSKSAAAAEFTSAYAGFLTNSQRILRQVQLPDTDGHPEYGRPTAHQNDQIASLMNQYRSRLSSIAWPAPASQDARIVESALADEAKEVL